MRPHVNDEIVESSEKMAQSLALMEEIRTGAGKVDEIIKSIENIAFQTNILALNAAVEAARAGQAGKGFAVVADEVRTLAAKSAEASKATTELISNMVSSIKRGSESMQETKRYMDNVVTDAAQITDVFHKISRASEEQSVSVSQVAQGADQISNVVQTNSATAEQSAAAQRRTIRSVPDAQGYDQPVQASEFVIKISLRIRNMEHHCKTLLSRAAVVFVLP